MHHTYPKTVRVFRLSPAMQMTVEIAVAMSAALFMSYLIVHGAF